MPCESAGAEVVPPFAHPDNIVHVIPINDLREHIHNDRGKCWCRPSIECGGDGAWYVIHQALDRRELWETGALQPF